MEKTIEQRAKEAYPHYSAENSERVMGARAGYIKGATEQKEIDDEEQADALFIQCQMLIDKAIRWYRCEYSHATAEWLDYECEKLRKAMEG